MTWKPKGTISSPHTGFLWAAIGIGLIVVGVQYMNQHPQRVVEARSPTNHVARPITNMVPTSQLSPEEMTHAVEAIGRLFSNPAESRSLDQWDLITLLRDPSAPLSERRRAARILAESDDPLALAFLSETAQTGTPRLRAIVAESLGYSSNPAAIQLLELLLADQDPTVARGGVRALLASPKPGTGDLLDKILNQTGRPESVRTEAALALGALPDPSATGYLAKAIQKETDETVLVTLWEAMGMRPALENAEFVRDYLNSPDTTAPERIMAIEALGESPDDVSPLLATGFNDPDPEVREAAAWALGRNDQLGNVGPSVLQALASEPDAGVRLRLYQAFENQQSVDPIALMPMLESEQRPEVRLAGIQALVHTSQSFSSQETSLWVDTKAVPILKEEALHHPNLLHRMTALTTLAQVGSPLAEEAIQAIGLQTDDARLASAAGGR